MIRTLLIANRGEIAVRIIRTAKAMGMRCVSVYSDADRDALHVACADEAIHIGASPSAESYLNQQAILSAAKRSRADAIHPGYGFLSENPEFAEAVERAGIIFVGPPAEAMRRLGLKGEAKRLMREAGVPVVPGYEGGDQSPGSLPEEAARIGFPLLIKPVAGGGGRGMRRVMSPHEFDDHLTAAKREALAGFGDDRVLIEKYLPAVRHIEVQVLADAHGQVLHLWERDCSAQRRHQKVIEEAPAPGLDDGLREAMCAAAVKAARKAGYVGAGTVEFLVPSGGTDFYFIEMNTRLQVEHPVTEMITGLDLVEWQLRIAFGEALTLGQEEVRCAGHAIEARIYAEDPAQGFAPQTGRITTLALPEAPGLRIDSGVRAGGAVSPYYDAMIAKVIAHGISREVALVRLEDALAQSHIGSLRNNIGFLARLLASGAVRGGEVDTSFIDRELGALTAPENPPLPAVAAATLALEGWLGPEGGTSPFERLRGFTLWGGEALLLKLLIDGEPVEVELLGEAGCFVLSTGGETLPFSIQNASLPAVSLEARGAITHMLCYRETESVTIVMNRDRWRISRALTAADASSSNGERRITSPVPGLLAKLMMEEGAFVKQGDTVAVVEAMKTEFTLKAEASGAVTYHAGPGAQVSEGQLIAEIADA